MIRTRSHRVVPYIDVKKTSIYLDEELDRALSRRAAEEGVKKAELIRRVLTAAVGRPRRPSAVGFDNDDAPVDLSANVDRYLAETGFGER